MTAHAAMIVPSLDGPSARGTTSVQSSVIVHVISCAPARTETLRLIFGASSGGHSGDGLRVRSAVPSDMSRSARARKSSAQLIASSASYSGDVASGSLERLFFRTFPDSVCGSSVRNTTSRGTMKFSSLVLHSRITSSSLSSSSLVEEDERANRLSQ